MKKGADVLRSIHLRISFRADLFSFSFFLTFFLDDSTDRWKILRLFGSRRSSGLSNRSKRNAGNAKWREMAVRTKIAKGGMARAARSRTTPECFAARVLPWTQQKRDARTLRPIHFKWAAHAGRCVATLVGTSRRDRWRNGLKIPDRIGNRRNNWTAVQKLSPSLRVLAGALFGRRCNN